MVKGEGVLKTERPASWPYLGAGAPPLAEPVGRTLRSGVFHIAPHASESLPVCTKESRAARCTRHILSPASACCVLYGFMHYGMDSDTP